MKKSAQEQGELRATESRRIVDRLGECIERPVAKCLLAASKLGGAFNTIRNHWEAFNVFAHDVACSQRAEDGSRCRDVFRERPNAHAPRDGQDRGVCYPIGGPQRIGEAVREYREQERCDKADTAVVQAARRRVRAELRKGK